MNRFSLRTLLLAVALFALALVATMNASRPWAVAIEALVYVLLSAAIVGALCTIGEQRAFWIGCAVFGWGLWLAGAANEVRFPGGRLDDVVASAIAPAFNTEEVVEHEEFERRKTGLYILSDYFDNNGVHFYRVINQDFERRLPEVIRALLVIVAGLLGGAIGGWMWRRRGRETMKAER
jgi:hypothetical protein